MLQLCDITAHSLLCILSDSDAISCLLDFVSQYNTSITIGTILETKHETLYVHMYQGQIKEKYVQKHSKYNALNGLEQKLHIN